MRFRLHGLVVVALSVALARPVARADGLCIEDTQIEPDLGRTLDRLVATAEVTVRSPGRCAVEGARLVGRFSRLEPVLFTLHTRSGEKFSRAVPWLTRPDAALVRLRAQGRLSAFSVLVEGLLAEQRLAAGQEEHASAATARSSASAGRTPSTRPSTARAQGRPGAAAQPRPLPAAPRSGDAPAMDAPEQPPLSASPSPPAGADAPVEPAAEPATDAPAAEPATDAPAGEPTGPEPAVDEGAGSAVVSGAAESPAEAPAAIGPPASPRAAAAPPEPAAAATTPAVVPSPAVAPPPPIRVEPPAAASAARPAPAPQRVSVPMSGQDARGRGRSDQPRTASAARVRARPGSLTWPGPEALVAARMRSSDTTGVEVGAGIVWRSLFARASYQAPVRWDLEGRPIDVTGMALTAGYRPAVYEHDAWRIGPVLAATLERVTVQRVDLQDAAVHPYWDPGVVVGGAISRDLAGGLSMTLQVEGCRLLGRTVRVPDGPEAAFNRLGARAALSIVWAP